MKERISLYLVSGTDWHNVRAYNILNKLPTVDLELVHCSESMANLFQCPFCIDINDRGYYGLIGIRTLAVRIQKRAEAETSNQA